MRKREIEREKDRQGDKRGVPNLKKKRRYLFSKQALDFYFALSLPGPAAFLEEEPAFFPPCLLSSHFR